MKKGQRKSNSTQQKILLWSVLLFVCTYTAIMSIRSIRNSLFFHAKDRINVVYYGQKSVALSIGLKDDIHYIMSFDNEDRVRVPGGYGRYPIGSLGKLSDIEKDRDILKRTFSSMTSSYFDYYVVPRNNRVYEKNTGSDLSYSRKNFIIALFSPSFTTNANIFDRLYISQYLARKREHNYIELESVSRYNEKDKRYDFAEDGFLKRYEGLFYYESLRKDGKEIIVQYHNDNSAVTLSRVIEGQGIRIVDLRYEENPPKKECIVVEKGKTMSLTAAFLVSRFGCQKKNESVEGSDILFILGADLEAQWE